MKKEYLESEFERNMQQANDEARSMGYRQHVLRLAKTIEWVEKNLATVCSITDRHISCQNSYINVVFKTPWKPLIATYTGSSKPHIWIANDDTYMGECWWGRND